MKTTCLLVLGAMALSGCVFAPGHGGNPPRAALEGTWVTTVSGAPGSPGPFLSIATYTPTGQSFEENNTTQIRSVGHGEWRRTGRATFQRTMTFFSFTDAHVYNGVARVVSDITVEPGGNTYREASRFEIYDPAARLVLTGENTGYANRCGAGSRIPVCLGLAPPAK
jgi:hypothetical protein